MEGSRSSKYKRGLGRAAWRRAHAVADTSPRRRTARRRRDEIPPEQGVYRRKYGNPQEQVWDAPFEFLGTVRNPRRRREPTPEPPDEPQRPQTPDPDDDPDPVLVAAALPIRSLARHERRNLDIEYSGTPVGGLTLWTVPIPTLVGIGRGPGYSERATTFVRVERLAFKITGSHYAHGDALALTVPPFPDPFFCPNAMYFRFAVIYDKQSDNTSPTVVYPDVYATGPTRAIDSFRLPALTERYEVLHDQTYRWKLGELSVGDIEVGGTGAPFWVQTGFIAKEEIFIECNKLVHYSSDVAGVLGITSGNMFYMISFFGVANLSLTVDSRTTYSDFI